MNILIVYGTTEGQTRKIAGFAKTELEKMNHKVTEADATALPPPVNGFDAVIIAASMHLQKYQTSVLDYIQKNKQALNTIHSAFLSVSLSAAGDDEDSCNELKKLTDEFLLFTGWKPCMIEYVAGALRFTEYDFFKKFIMRMIAHKQGETPNTNEDKEYTDWNKLQAFLKIFIERWNPAPQTVRNNESDQQAVA